MKSGEMVRANDGGPLMKILDRAGDLARCVWFDQHGRVHERDIETKRLVPFWISTGPRSLWPEMGQLDAVEIAKEEQAAATARRLALRASKRARRSNKIKGRKHAAA